MRIYKPMSLGLLHKPYRHQGRDRLVIAALGFFRLGEPATCFLTEHLQWPQVLKALPQGEPLDAVMPKPRAEYLLAAKAFAPGGQPVTRMTVAVQVGELSKQLQVTGDRQWRYGLLPWHDVDQPEPFIQMPISYQRAYGGDGHPGNPVGTGYTGSRLGAFAGVNQGAMPNIAYPGEEPRDHHRRCRPAGFMPLDIRWQPRAGELGSYDQAWLENDFPGLAADLDWDAFSTAPADQRFPAYLRGGEPYRLEGMHPSRPVLEGTLPDMRTRAFLLRKDQAADACEEVTLHFDTLWLFPEFALGVAIYRGQADIADSEADDVEALLVGYEHNGDAAKPIAHYRQVLALRMDPETCVMHALNDAQLTPLPSSHEQRARQQEQAAAEADYLARQQAQLDEVSAEFWDATGMDKPEGYQPPRAELPPLGLTPQVAIERGDLDLTELMTRAKALTEHAEQQRQRAEQRLKDEQDKRLAALIAQGEALRPDVDDALQQAEARAAVPTDRPGRPWLPDPRLDALLAKVRAGDTMLSDDEHRALDDTLAKLPALERQGRRASPEPLPQAPGEAVARHLGELVRRWHAAGEPLAGRDLSGADLAGIDLSGADLREVMLEHADLRGACLAGARLNGAVLTAARLDGADLGGADLSEANLSRCRAARAAFRGARLDRVLASESDFSGADFSAASLCNLVAQTIDLGGAVLDGADLSRALLQALTAPASSWKGAHFELAMLVGACLDLADLSGARFDSCVLLQLRASESCWRDAMLTRVFAGDGAILQQADLCRVRASHSSLRAADLRQADLGEAVLTDCDLGGADLTMARLANAVCSRSLFIRTCLRSSDARAADFYQALLRKADLSRADLRDANLVAANLFGACLDDADLRGVRPRPLGRAA